MLETVARVWKLFSPREKWQALGLLALSLATGILEMLGVASILPFLGLLAQPELATANPWLNQIYVTVGFSSVQTFLFFTGLVVLVLMVLTNTLLAVTSWLMERFTWTKQHTLSTQLLQGYLARPYVDLLDRNSAELSRNILVETYNLARSVLTPLSDIIMNAASIGFILLLLVWVNPAIALGTAAVFGGAYAAVYFLLRRRMRQQGKRAQRADAKRFKAVSEALGGIKDVRVLGREQEFIRRYAIPSREYGKAQSEYAATRELPRLVLETLAFGSILAIVLYMMAVEGNVGAILPVVGVYAFAGYRLLPALRALFKSLSVLRFSQATVTLVAQEVEANREALTHKSKLPAAAAPLPFQHSIELRGGRFQYPAGKKAALDGVTMQIGHRRQVAIVGPTGAGKTTLVDVLLGLFPLDSGTLSVDGVLITDENLMGWRQILGYVPQQIYLSDDTLTRNIAFGIADSAIDHSAVERAARIANLHDFIVSDLPNGYETLIGERGVRLSGGQRQRVGIARALYHDPEVLILDEATSALDGITEEAVLQAIETVARSKTTVTIAHRLTTIQDCDVIYLLDKGRVAAQGTYAELMASNAQFRAMARMGGDEPEPVNSFSNAVL